LVEADNITEAKEVAVKNITVNDYTIIKIVESKIKNVY
jgi:hypothetical protein